MEGIEPVAAEYPIVTFGGDAAREFLEKYFGQQQIDVYWGSAPQFVADLASRLPAASGGPGG